MERTGQIRNVTTARFPGLDVLRLLTMWMIALFHCVVHGKLCELPAGEDIYYVVRAFCACAVNVYALISGFVLIHKSTGTVSRLLNLWFQVFFYSVLISLAAFFRGVSVSELIKSCFPLLFDRYWYFSAYFLVGLFSPFLNKACLALKKEHFRGFLFALLMVCCFVGLFSSYIDIDAFSLKAGYSALWLLILYLLGAYLRLHGNLIQIPRWKWALLYVCCCAATLLSRYVISVITTGTIGYETFTTILFSYRSPTNVLAAIALMGLVSNLQLKPALQKAARFFGGATFGVYLIHDHKIVREYVIADIFQNNTSMPWYGLAAKLAAVSIGIFVICILIDIIRSYTFKLFHVKQLCNRVENKLLSVVLR